MIKVDGKDVLTTLDELVEPGQAALLVVDMQRDFCMPGGAFDLQGMDISAYRGMVPKLRRLLQEARSAEVTVIYLKMTVLRDRRSESGAQIRFNMRAHLGGGEPDQPLWYTIDGSDGQRILAELAPKPTDLVVQKYRSSGFWGSNLDMLLRSNDIQTVIMTGCTTEGCVESTARDALFNDYYVVVVEDCVASDDPQQHEASLLLMRHRFDVAASEEIVTSWQRRTSHSARLPLGNRIGRT